MRSRKTRRRTRSTSVSVRLATMRRVPQADPPHITTSSLSPLARCVLSSSSRFLLRRYRGVAGKADDHCLPFRLRLSTLTSRLRGLRLPIPSHLTTLLWAPYLHRRLREFLLRYLVLGMCRPHIPATSGRAGLIHPSATSRGSRTSSSRCSKPRTSCTRRSSTRSISPSLWVQLIFPLSSGGTYELCTALQCRSCG
jgi:hypothetical protein